MEIKLVVLSGKHAGKEIAVQSPNFVIGRDEDCQLRPNSDQVSRKHCEIVSESGSVLLRDFGSKNGSFVNDQRVEGSRELKTGDRLRVAHLEFEVQLSTGIGGKKKPKVQDIKDAAARLVKAAADEDLDVSDWLNRLDSAADDTVITETPATVIQSVAKQKPTEKAPPTPDPAPTEERNDGKRSVLFKTQSGGKSNSATSGDAAADVLRRMFNQK